MRAAFRSAGIDTHAPDPDAAVVTARSAGVASSRAIPTVIVLGRGGRRAARRRWIYRRSFLSVPEVERPQLIFPVDRPHVARFVVDSWVSSESVAKRVRNRLAALSVAARMTPELSGSVCLGQSRLSPPFLVSEASALGVPSDSDWFVTFGHADALSRGVFHLFARGERLPSWALKFSRVPGNESPFDRDARGLAIAAQSGPVLRAHVPLLLGRFTCAGLPASVETAAVGKRLTHLLQARAPRGPKLRVIDEVASWIVDFGVQSSTSAATIRPELERLEQEVLPHWGGRGITTAILDGLEEVPAVLQHNDLGSWNIVAGGGSFTVVDWESASPHGLPLWDLVYFLVDALVHLDGEWSPSRRRLRAAKILRGEVASSAVLFRWIRRAVDVFGLPQGRVGRIVTLGWLHHGTSRFRRQATADSLRVGGGAEDTYGEWMSDVWLRERGLGATWSAWEA
jgi:hypothetical protein